METVSPSIAGPVGANGRRLNLKNADPCTYCGELVEMFSTSAGRGKMAHRACRLKNPVARRIATCGQCAKQFETRKRADGRWIKSCSKSCARKLEVHQGTHLFSTTSLTPEESKLRRRNRGELAARTRRARLAKVARDPYTAMSIADRDRCICGLCGGMVDLRIEWPHPESATVDHIIPLSRGGDDTLGNVQLAHAGCNLSKHNRI